MKNILIIMMCLCLCSLGLFSVYAVDYDVVSVDDLYDVLKASESDYEKALDRVWEDSCVDSLKYAGFSKTHFLSYYDLMTEYVRILTLNQTRNEKNELVLQLTNHYTTSLPESFITLVNACGDRSEVFSILYQLSYETIALEEHLKGSDEILRYLKVSESFEISLQEALGGAPEVSILSDQMRLFLELQVIVLNDSLSKEDMDCLFEVLHSVESVEIKDVAVLTDIGKEMVVIEDFIPHRSSETLTRDITLLKSMSSITLETFQEISDDVKKETLSTYMELVEETIVNNKLIGSEVDLLMTTVDVINQVDANRLTELKNLILVSMVKELQYVPEHSMITRSDIESSLKKSCDYGDVFDDKLDDSEHMLRIEMNESIDHITLDESAISSLLNAECQVLIVDGDLMIRLTLEDLDSSQWITYQTNDIDAVAGDYKTFEITLENELGALREVLILRDISSDKEALTLCNLSDNQWQKVRYEMMYDKLAFNHIGGTYRIGCYDPKFEDLEMWAKPYILDVVSKGWMTGLTETKFGPDEVVSSGELSEILMDWTDQTYEVSHTPLTRGDMAVMICDAYESKYGYELSGNGQIFSDHKTIPRDIRKSVYKLRAAGIISGYQDNSYRVDQEVTRAELAVVLCKLLN